MLTIDSCKQCRWQAGTNLNIVNSEVVTLVCISIISNLEPNLRCTFLYGRQFKFIILPVVWIRNATIHCHRRYWTCCPFGKQICTSLITIESHGNVWITCLIISLVVYICSPERNQQPVNTITFQINFILIKISRILIRIHIEQISLVYISRMGMVVKEIEILPMVTSSLSKCPISTIVCHALTVLTIP